MTGLLKVLLVFGPGLIMLLALLSFEKALRKGDDSRLYLVLFLFVSAFLLGAHGLVSFAQQPYYQWADAIQIPLELSVIPLFFMFLNGVVTGNYTRGYKRLLHLLIPLGFLLSVPVIIIVNTLSGQPYTQSDLVTNWITVGHTFFFLQTMAYTIRIFTRSHVYSKMLQTFYSRSQGNFLSFRYLLISFSAFFLFLDSWLMSFVILAPVFPFVYSVLVSVSAVLTGWFGLNIDAPDTNRITAEISESESIKVFPGKNNVPAATQTGELKKSDRQIIDDSIPAIDQLTEEAKKEKKLKPEIHSARRPFDEHQKEELYKRMLDFLVTNEAYTNPKLTLKQLAVELGTNTRYLSQVINEFQGRNFNQMLNYYRVKKVMRLLVDNEAQSYSYVGLAQKAGFHSKSVFISAFKSQTGTTPSEFSGTMKKLIQS